VEETSVIARRARWLRAPAGLGRAAFGPHLASHHRRRRAVTLAAMAVVALVAGIAAGSGSGSSVQPRALAAQGGYFGALATLGGSGPRSFTADQAADGTAAVNHTLAYTPYVRVAGAQHRELALTFDDGPGPYTPAVLAVLRRMAVPATFFEVGVLDRYFHSSTSEIAELGDPIGDHTQLHAPMSQLSRRDQRLEILDDASTLGQYGAPFPRLFRPPYGMWNNTTISLLAHYRMLMVLWTVDTNDYRQPGVKAIIDTTLDGARPGAIILLHDAGGNRSQTVAALPRIIRKLRARGYKLVTVPQLLLDNPAPKDQQYTPGALGGGG
jgi:peptidoglycan/xylan/chitin deacetylase (PgdA/CDA1 family)